jgi:hypothetical protein
MRSIIFGLCCACFAGTGCGGKERRDAVGPGANAGIGGDVGGAGSAGGSSAGAPSAGSAGELAGGSANNNGSCEPYCGTTADCCSDCSYPRHLECQDRHCVSLGCTADSDCVTENGPKSICRLVVGFPRCIELCQQSSDCGKVTAVCAATDDDGDKFCGTAPGLIRPCDKDSECIGVCDPITHQCGCSADTQCPSGSICAPVP